MSLVPATPPLIPTPFAQSANPANIDTIPATTGVAGQAAYDVGFPPVTMEPVVAGGIPPKGQDFNGILFAITAHLYWTQAGRLFQYNAAVAAAIGGYSPGTLLSSSDGLTMWFNQVNGNTSDPDGGTGIANGWRPVGPSVNYAICSTTGGTYTASDNNARCGVLFIVGALTSNVRFVLPNIPGEWLLINSTTGGFTVSAACGGGVTINIPNGGPANPVGVYTIGDGNMYPSVSPLSIPISQGPDALTLAERTNNGYLLATYFNMSAPQNDGAPVLEIMTGANDGYVRRNTVAVVEAVMALSAIGGQVTAGQVPVGAVTQYTPQILASAALTGSPTAPTAGRGNASGLVANTAFVNPGSSLTTNGYRLNPDGTITQWGSFATTANAGTVNATFPTPFPNQCTAVATSCLAPSGVGGAGSREEYLTAISTTGFSIHEVAASNTAISISWQATGF